jgi:hypothetical protein
MATDTFSKFEPKEYFPGSELQTDAELADAVGQQVLSRCQHFLSSRCMGHDWGTPACCDHVCTANHSSWLEPHQFVVDISQLSSP